MGEGVRWVRSERKFGPEDGLTLKSSSLSDEEMVEVALKWLLMNVKDFAAKMHAKWTIGPSGNNLKQIRIVSAKYLTLRIKSYQYVKEPSPPNKKYDREN